MVDISSPLVQRIRRTLDGLELAHARLYVSVARDMKWEESGAGGSVHVRWLCWSIEDGDREVVAPEFEIVGETVTRERLMAELPVFFPDIEVRVDHEIDVP